MTDRVDAVVHGVQPSDPQAVLDCAASEPEREQLTAGDDAVLALTQHRERMIAGQRCNKGPMVGPLLSSCRHGPDDGGQIRACGARIVPTSCRTRADSAYAGVSS